MCSSKCYIAIDLKSFYASVECVERGLDPMDANLVVADESRTEKTICLAVSPALKRRGVPGRPRLFEVVSKVSLINHERLKTSHSFRAKSFSDAMLRSDPYLEMDYIVAKPRMQLYMDYSARVVEVYLKYIAAEDLDVYSVDEVFIDATSYLDVFHVDGYEFARLLLRDVLETTGITATAGIGTNLYLAKIAMDIVAKHVVADAHGVRIAGLDERSYRLKLWDHRPLTDFWRVGPGIAQRLAALNIYTMGDICRVSEGIPGTDYNEDLLFSVLGVNAELLIDHAWGYESTTLADIKKLNPIRKSLGIGQVLSCPYDHDKACLIVWEMAEQLSLELVEKGYTAAKAVLHISFDVENLKDPRIKKTYENSIVKDHYGRHVPASVRGTVSFGVRTSSSDIMSLKLQELFRRISPPELKVRKVSIAAIDLGRINDASVVLGQNTEGGIQTDLFLQSGIKTEEEILQEKKLERELKLQRAVISLKKRYGKNAVFRGADLLDGATTLERNSQIGGHKA